MVTVPDAGDAASSSDSYATSKSDEDEGRGSSERDASRAALRPGQSISISRESAGGAHLLAMMYSGNSVALPSDKGTYVEVVDLFSREVVDKSLKHESSVACLDATDDGSRYISIGDDGSADVYHRLDDGSYDHVVKDDRFCDFPVDTDIDPSGDFATVVCSDLSVRVVDMTNGEDWSFRGSRGGFECATFSPDSLWLLAGSTRGDVYVWDLETGERHLRLAIPDLDESIVQVGWLPETFGFYAVTAFGRLLVWPEYPEPNGRGESELAPEFDWSIADVPLHLIETVRGGGSFVMSRDALTVELWDVGELVRTERCVESRRHGFPLRGPEPAEWCPESWRQEEDDDASDDDGSAEHSGEEWDGHARCGNRDDHVVGVMSCSAPRSVEVVLVEPHGVVDGNKECGHAEERGGPDDQKTDASIDQNDAPDESDEEEDDGERQGDGGKFKGEDGGPAAGVGERCVLIGGLPPGVEVTTAAPEECGLQIRGGDLLVDQGVGVRCCVDVCFVV